MPLTQHQSRLANIVDYTAATLISSHAVMVLDDVREGKGPSDKALEALTELRAYLRENSPCFLDYIKAKGKTSNQDYTNTTKQIALALNGAEQELREGRPGKGIDSAIQLADDFGNVCISLGIFGHVVLSLSD